MNLPKAALASSPTPAAADAAEALSGVLDWVAPHDADLIIALGGDGFMLQTLHRML